MGTTPEPICQRLVLAHALLPCVVAVPLLAGIAASIADLVTTRHPHLGFAQAIAADAHALAIGDALYADPAEQYGGMLYAPGLPALLAPLYRVLWWDGWGVIVSTAAALGLVAVIALVGGSGVRRDRFAAVAGGVGVGGVAWWLVSTTPRDALLEARPDHVAWFFALAGLTALAAGVSRGSTRMWPAVVLLTAALWTKQTTVAAPAAAAVVACWWARSELISWSTWRRLVGGLALLNVAIAATLMVVTDGWVRFFMLTMPGRHHQDPAIAPYLAELARLVALPAVLLALAAVALGASIVRVDRRSFTVLLVALLVVFIVLSIGPAWLGHRKQGGRSNQYLGMMWAFGFLLALAHREALRSRRAVVAGLLSCSLVLAVTHVPLLRDDLRERGVDVPPPVLVVRFSSLSADILEYAEDHTVYLPRHGVLGTTAEVWPLEPHLVDLLAAGETPDYFVDALLERRFDAVMPFIDDAAARAYISRSGRTDAGYLSRLNDVIHAGYEPGAAPGPLLVRRPGPLDLSWMEECFELPIEGCTPGETGSSAAEP